MRWHNEKKWITEPNGDINQRKMVEDMGIFFRVIDENYDMSTEFNIAWTTLQNSGLLRDKRIRQNLANYIDWMEKI